MTMAMGGLAAERLILGGYRLGGASDINNATGLARTRIASAADPGARPVSYGSFEDSPLAMDELFALTAASVMAARTAAEGLVSVHRAAIESLATTLAAEGHLSGAELREALDEAGLPGDSVRS